MAVEMMEEEASAQRRPLARPIAAMLSGSLVVLALICVILSRKEGATGRYGALLEIRGRRVEKELIRRQDGTAEIEKGLMRQKKAGKQALTALLNLVPLPAVSTVGQGRGGNMRLASSDMSVGVKTSVSIVGNSTLGNLGYIKNTMSTNATNKTVSF